MPGSLSSAAGNALRWLPGALAVAVTLLSAPALGQTVPASLGSRSPPQERIDSLDWRGAVALARERNPAVRVARAGIAEAAAGVRLANAQGRPRVVAQGLYLRYEDPPSVQLGPFGSLSPFPTNGYVVAAYARQPLYTGGRSAASKRAAMHAGTVASHQAVQVDVELTADAALAFADAQLARDLVFVSRELVIALEAAERVAERQYDAGTVARIDVLRATNRLARGRAELRHAEEAAIVARERLAVILDVSLHALPPLAGGIESHTRIPSQDEVAGAQELAADRGEIAALRAAAAAEDARADAARAESRPGAMLYVAGVGTRPELVTGAREWGWEWLAGIAVTWSAFDAGESSARRAQAGAVAERRRAEADQRARTSAAQIRIRYRELSRSAVDLEEARANVERSEQALRLAEERYVEGLAIQLEVLEAQAEWNASRAELLRAAHAGRTALLELKRAAGIPADGDLRDSPTGR